MTRYGVGHPGRVAGAAARVHHEQPELGGLDGGQHQDHTAPTVEGDLAGTQWLVARRYIVGVQAALQRFRPGQWTVVANS